jgi:shikimate 5-dehydrogenase
VERNTKKRYQTSRTKRSRSPALGVPSDSIVVVVNVTPTNTQALGYLTLYPAGSNPPTASNLNWISGDIVTNQTTVGLGKTEEISFYTPQDFANLVVELDGIFGPVPLTTH